MEQRLIDGHNWGSIIQPPSGFAPSVSCIEDSSIMCYVYTDLLYSFIAPHEAGPITPMALCASYLAFSYIILFARVEWLQILNVEQYLDNHSANWSSFSNSSRSSSRHTSTRYIFVLTTSNAHDKWQPKTIIFVGCQRNINTFFARNEMNNFWINCHHHSSNPLSNHPQPIPTRVDLRC